MPPEEKKLFQQVCKHVTYEPITYNIKNMLMEARDEQPAKTVRSTSKTLQEKLTYLCTAKQNG